MNLAEAFKEIDRIVKECPDIAVKVVTTRDIIHAVLGADAAENLTPEQEEKARELARNCWEKRNWRNLEDSDWAFFSEAFSPFDIGLD